MIKIFDLVFSLVGIIVLSPVLLMISIFIKISSSGPVFYKQSRVGFLGNDILVWKFRTMKINSDKAGLLTVGGRDSRITSIGYYLRKFKLDELPQLFNVLKGDMSLVGPRPEVRKYVELYTVEQKRVLSVKPGITDWASIMYRDENIILEKSNNPEHDYISKILPDKISYNLIFINKYTVVEYLKIIAVTFWRIIVPLK
jgi:lipopolysaccharide/colanic/teichoic acid biosynthesis glycosyltransferase